MTGLRLGVAPRLRTFAEIKVSCIYTGTHQLFPTRVLAYIPGSGPSPKSKCRAFIQVLISFSPHAYSHISLVWINTHLPVYLSTPYTTPYAMSSSSSFFLFLFFVFFLFLFFVFVLFLFFLFFLFIFVFLFFVFFLFVVFLFVVFLLFLFVVFLFFFFVFFFLFLFLFFLVYSLTESMPRNRP